MGKSSHALCLLNVSYYFSNVMDSAKPKTHFLSTSLYFSTHMYFERSLIHMFQIYLHASHQNVVLYELFDVLEACWAFPLRFFSPPLGSGSMICTSKKPGGAHQNPQYFFLKGSNFVQKLDCMKTEYNSNTDRLLCFPAPNWQSPS